MIIHAGDETGTAIQFQLCKLWSVGHCSPPFSGLGCCIRDSVKRLLHELVIPLEGDTVTDTEIRRTDKKSIDPINSCNRLNAFHCLAVLNLNHQECLFVALTEVTERIRN